MGIQSHPIGGNSSPEPRRADITRANRDSIERALPEIPLDGPEQDGEAQALQKRIQSAREEHAAKLAKRIENAREQQQQERIQNAREEARADRIQNARQDARADRIQNAREKHAQDEIVVSSSGRALADALQAVDPHDREDKIRELKARNERGELDTQDLIARAAHRLLGGE